MQVKQFAALGAGVIGSGWVSRALAHGLDVTAWDPAPGAEAALRANVANAWPALERVGSAKVASPERLRVVATVEECVADADFIHESAPERIELKLALHERVSRAAKPEAIIGSSTSGLLLSEFYANAVHPERCVVGHPFNPVYLLPLVEVLGGEHTSGETIDATMSFYASIGIRPLKVRGSAWFHRRQIAGSALARGAASRERWRVDDQRDRRCDPLRRGHPLVLHGHVPDLHAGGRRGGHATLHAAVRARARIAVDEARRADLDRRADRPRGGRHVASDERARHQGTGAVSRRLHRERDRGDRADEGARHGIED